MKPYPKTKPSGVQWLGYVPEHWELKRLKMAAELTDKKVEADEENPVPYIGLEHIESWSGRLLPIDPDLIPSGIANSFHSGHVLFGKLRPYLAKACTPDFDGLCSTELLVLQGKDLNPDSLRYTLLSEGFIDLVDSSTYGSKMPRANWSFIGDCVIPIAPTAEQTAIAAYLDRETGRIDELVGKKRDLIERLKEKRTALISRTVTRGLPADLPPATLAKLEALAGQKLPLSPACSRSELEWVEEIPSHWMTGPLKGLARRERKSFTDGDWVELPFITDEGVRLIQTGNVGIGAYKEQGYRFVSEESFSVLGCTEVFPNDVLICRLDGPVGRACLAPELGVRMITSVDNTILKPNSETSAEYVVRLLSSTPWLQWIEALCRVGGGFRMRISRLMLGNIRVPIPPLPEQRAIAAYLDEETAKLDALVAKVETAIERLQEYRTALITAAVTGKIQVSSTRK